MHKLWNLLFPPRCILCKRLLKPEQTDLCHHCREKAPEVGKENFKYSFIARWCAIWYYKDDVRESILRYKFRGRRSFADVYGRLLAMKLQHCSLDQFDVLTWVPVSALRRHKRGFDQTEEVALAVARELGITAVKTLKKIRHTKPQSTMGTMPHRKANILGAFQVIDPALVRDKRILLLDDIITTGATASEAARMLLTAGAKEVKLATLAVASHDKR